MKYKIVCLGLSLFLYGIALALPCLLFNGVPTESVGVSPSDPSDVYAMKGIELTFLGIIGLLFLQIPAIGWLANPIYWLCCITFMMQHYRFASIAGIAAILVGFGGTFSAFWFNLPADSGGVSEFAWKLLGLFPVMTGTGDDITRSAAGRFHTELMLLPSALCLGDVTWSSPEASHLHASFMAQGEQAELDLTIDQAGRLKTAKLPRWGNPDGAEHRYVDFGAIVEEEGTFCGYTIPTRLRVGWYFGTERFEAEGEFFRATIDDAIYQ